MRRLLRDGRRSETGDVAQVIVIVIDIAATRGLEEGGKHVAGRGVNGIVIAVNVVHSVVIEGHDGFGLDF